MLVWKRNTDGNFDYAPIYLTAVVEFGLFGGLNWKKKKKMKA